MALTWLFVSAFISASLFPLASEVVVLALLEQGQGMWAVWLIASVGNTLGSMTSFALGWYGIQVWPVASKRAAWVHRHYERWGYTALLLSWLPLVGDFIPLLAGILRLNTGLSMLVIFIAKSLRYLVLIGSWWFASSIA